MRSQKVSLTSQIKRTRNFLRAPPTGYPVLMPFAYRIPEPFGSRSKKPSCEDCFITHTGPRSCLLRETWVPPEKDVDGNPTGCRKDPLQQSVLSVQCAWQLFEAVWECRNCILNSAQNNLDAQGQMRMSPLNSWNSNVII